MTHGRIIALLASIAVLANCGRSENAEPPISSGGTTDAAFDWEHPLPAEQKPDRSWSKLLTFKSTKTLEQTTRWLAWAIARYGHAKGIVDTRDVADVRFDKCTMQWFERKVDRISEKEEGVTTESRYALRLSDIDLRMSTPRVESNQITIGLTNATEVMRRYFEHGQPKGEARPEHERIVYIPIRDSAAEQIGDRIAWALIHAARLCGAKVQTNYDDRPE